MEEPSYSFWKIPAFAKFVEGPILISWPLLCGINPLADVFGAPSSALVIVISGKNVLPSRFRFTELGVKGWAVVALATSRTNPSRFSQVAFGVKRSEEHTSE